MKTEQTNTPDPQLREQLDAKSKKFTIFPQGVKMALGMLN